MNESEAGAVRKAVHSMGHVVCFSSLNQLYSTFFSEFTIPSIFLIHELFKKTLGLKLHGIFFAIKRYLT